MPNLSFPRKLAYASGGLALNFANLLISQWLLRLYVPDQVNALVAPALFSLIFLIGRIVDGVIDPFVGYFNDRFRSRWGRRKPFIALALIPTALVSALMWFPPFPHELSWVNGVFIFVLVQLFFIFWTALANPYLSMIPEISRDLNERVDITTWYAVFLMVGTVLSALIGNIKEAAGWGGLGVTVGLVAVVSFLPTLLFVPEPPAPPPEKRAGSLRGELGGMALWIGTTFGNFPFVVLLTATSLFWFALNLMIILVPFWVQHVCGRGDGDVIMIMLPYIAANLIAFAPANLASKRWGKQAVFMATLALSAAASFSLALVGRTGLDPFLQTQLTMALYGLATSGFLMLPNALLADVIDYDAARSGSSRAAVHFGVQSFFQNSANGLSIVAAAALMYVGGRATPTPLGLKLIAGVSGLAAATAALVWLAYPLRDKPKPARGAGA
jgi:GPH family glycoside/pentoside/hexuronide:cation symporter